MNKTMRQFSMREKGDLQKSAAVGLCVAFATAGAAREGSFGRVELAQLGDDGPAPEIFRFEAGELISTKPLRHRVRLNYRPTFNVSANFQNTGVSGGMVPPPGAGVVARDYDDGFVRPETTGLAAGSPDGFTSYWSYQNASQVVGNNLLMSKAVGSGAIAGAGSIGSDPMHGMELAYSWMVGPAGPFEWGLEGSFGFSGLDIRDDRTLTGNVNVTTDTFDISNLAPGGGPPPPPGTPTTGRSGTSALIGVAPASRSTSSFIGATSSGFREVTGNIYDFRVGPFMEYEVVENLRLGLGGGFSFGFVNSNFAFQETVNLPGGSPLNNNGSGSDVKPLYGGYVSATVDYSFADSWSVFAGAQYRRMGKYDQSVGGSSVEVDFRNAIQATFGVGYSF